MNTVQMISPIGVLSITEQNGRLAEVFFGEKPETAATPLLIKAKKQFEEYFSGKRKYFDLPCAQAGGGFYESVWRQMSSIPYGETMTYGQIAEAIGRPGGSRAVGGACNKNALPIIVPCHRVVGSKGLIGFAGGLDKKEFLLGLEKNNSRA